MTDSRRVDEAAVEVARIRARAATIVHPVQSLLMCVLATEPSLGAEELAERLEISVRTVRMHLRRLVKQELVAVEREEHRRGVAKRYYASCGSLQIDGREDRLLPDVERRRTSLAVLRTIVRGLMRAAAWPELSRRHDRVVANVPGLVDARGWTELSKLHHEMLDRVEEIMVDARRRVAIGAEPIRVISQQILLETSAYRRPSRRVGRTLRKN